MGLVRYRFLCHGYCQMGKSPATGVSTKAYLQTIKQLLDMREFSAILVAQTIIGPEYTPPALTAPVEPVLFFS
jgi:hypothetical protein